MGNKTSQLQIRVSPEQKRALKRLAAAAGMSVSRYVLTTVLPTAREEFTRRAHGLAELRDRAGGLGELKAFLAGLSGDDLSASVSMLDLEGLSAALRNHLAATVEQAAWLRGQSLPAWVRGVEPLDRPQFQRDLHSLRPHLMRVTPVTFKRRNTYLELEPPGSDEIAARAARAAEAPEGLSALDEQLRSRGVLAEICTSDGALVVLSFSASPPTRNPKSLFQPLGLVQEAVNEVASAKGWGPRWIADAARHCVGPASGANGFLELANLRVFEARPDYLLALKCAAMARDGQPDSRDDLRHLVRSLGLITADDALSVVRRYFAQRQLPPDIETTLADALAGAA